MDEDEEQGVLAAWRATRIENMRRVAILFARPDSIYKLLRGCDVYDMARDARTFKGGMPVVCHPPCRAWGILSHLAKPRHDEKDLARWSVDQIRIEGGVLEHPAGSKLWADKGLPEPGERDAWGGWTLAAPQWWWGHKANKPTRFYICGIEPKDCPPIPIQLGDAPMVVTTNHTAPSYKRNKHKLRPEMSPKEREHTPPALAEWLVELARRTRKPSKKGDSNAD